MRFVVDASVAEAAGRGDPGSAPPSPACVGALDAIAAAGHGVAMSPELKDEWQRHARDYARKWLLNMVSRKRLHAVRPRWRDQLHLLEVAAELPGHAGREVAKDVHIVALAMETDQRVLPLDRRQRALLERCVHELPSLRSLHWANPSESGAEAWIRAGAVAPSGYELQAG